MLNIFFSNMSHPAYFEESRNGIGWTMGRGRGKGGGMLSDGAAPFNCSGVGLIMTNQLEVVPKTQFINQIGEGRHGKVIAARRVLELQKDARVTFMEEEGVTTEGLVELEEVAVKLKASREEGKVPQ